MGTLSGGKPYVKWEHVGQVVAGVLTKVEMSRSSRGGKMAHLVNDDGEAFIVSAPTLLAEILEENFALLDGKRIVITFQEQDKPAKKGESGLMRFKVDYPDDEDTPEAGKKSGRT